MRNLHLYRKVAQLHCDFINQGFLSTLGPSFLTLLYEAIDNEKSSVLIVLQVDGEVVGFVSGARNLLPIYKRLAHRPVALILALASCFLSVPKLFKIMELLLLSKNTSSYTEMARHELLTIVVNPSRQGQGYAEMLFRSLCDHFRAIDVARFKIVVGADLARAHAFYVKMGCVVVGELEVHKGSRSVVYVKHCA